MENITLYLNLIYYPLKTLGVGTRVGIWFEGCNIGCEGCISKHTWKQREENRVLLRELLTQIQKYPSKKVTISGGEPFYQPKALKYLVKFLKEREYEILIYSGYEYNYLKKNFSDILNYIDILIDAPFNQNLKSEESFRGSSNQKIYIFNPKLENIYQKFAKDRKRKLQIIEKNSRIYLLGIPKIGDNLKI